MTASPRFPGHKELVLGDRLAEGDKTISRSVLCDIDREDIGARLITQDMGLYFRPVPQAPAMVEMPPHSIHVLLNNLEKAAVHESVCDQEDRDTAKASTALKAARLAVESRVRELEAKEEMGFRGGFLAGTSFGMNQTQGHDGFNAPDENAAWEIHKSSVSGQGPGLSAEEGKE